MINAVLRAYALEGNGSDYYAKNWQILECEDIQLQEAENE